MEVNWEPLKLILEDTSVQSFMFMGSVCGPESVTIYLYKHSANRAYINMDAQGRCYKYLHTVTPQQTCNYVEIPRDEALRPFFQDGWNLHVKRQIEVLDKGIDQIKPKNCGSCSGLR